jgi:hypothetical protein
MTRERCLDILGGWLKIMDGLPGCDALADLVALAYPDHVLKPGQGFGDPLLTIRRQIDAMLVGIDYVATRNNPCLQTEQYRDLGVAIRQCLEIAEVAA